MLTGIVALTLAAAFTGAAIYVGFAEQRARLALDDRALLAEWQPSYKRGAVMQASLAAVSFLLGLVAWWQAGAPAFLIGAVLIILPWPWTLVVMMPVNKALTAMQPSNADPGMRALIVRWGKLHAVRSVLGALATLAFLMANLSN